MLKIYKDVVAGSFLSISAILMFLSSFNIHKIAKSTIGSAFVPQLVSICIFLLSICLVINGLNHIHKKINFPLIQTFILLIIYVSFLKSIGFLIMTCIYLFIQFFILSDKAYKNMPLHLTISIITTVSTYYLFTRIFYVMLPSGLLG